MHKTNAFVLRRQDFREYDRIYTVYTSDFGKMSLLARGARKIKSKLSPHLEAFGEVRVNFARGKVFTHLSGASVLKHNNTILKNEERIKLISDFYFLIDRFVKPEEEDDEIYGLLREASSLAGASLTSDLSKIKIYFFWRLVDLLGYRPQLHECALCGLSSRHSHLPSCHSREGGNLKLNLTDNIIICGECVGDGVFIHGATLENLKKIFQSSPADFLKTEISAELSVITEKAKQIKLSEL